MCVFQNLLVFGGVEGVEAMSCDQVWKSNFFITKTRQKALGLDRVTPTLQRNREKKPPGNEKKADCLKNNSGFL